MDYLCVAWAYVVSLPSRVQKWPIWTWPNFLSLLRMLAVFPLGWMLHEHLYALSVVTYAIAMSTDFFDGYTARKFNQISDFGKLLDPLADKVLHLYLLRQFQFLYPEVQPQYALIWKFAVVLAVLPSFAYVLDNRRRLGSNLCGKSKLCAEVLAILALYCVGMHWHPSVLRAFPALWISSPYLLTFAGITLWAALTLAGGSIIGHLLIKESFDYRWWKKKGNKK